MICVGWSTETVACRSKNVAMRYRWFRGARNPDLAPEPEISFAVYRMHHVEPDQMAARLEHRDALGEHATPVDHARPVMEGILGAVRRVRKNGIESFPDETGAQRRPLARQALHRGSHRRGDQRERVGLESNPLNRCSTRPGPGNNAAMRFR